MARGRSLFRGAPAAGLGSFEARQVLPQRLPRTTTLIQGPILVGVWGPYVAGYGWTANPLAFTAPLRRSGYA